MIRPLVRPLCAIALCIVAGCVSWSRFEQLPATPVPPGEKFQVWVADSLLVLTHVVQEGDSLSGFFLDAKGHPGGTRVFIARTSVDSVWTASPNTSANLLAVVPLAVVLYFLYRIVGSSGERL